MDPNIFRRRPAPVLHVLPRQDETYRAGWPLGYIGATCPSDAPVVCKRASDEEPQGCCPQGQFCFTTISEVYCCPTESDCGTAAANKPICANPAWTLFGLSSNRYFCCPAGYFGVKSVELSGRGICEENLDGISATRIASTIAVGNGTPGPATTGTATTATSRGGAQTTAGTGTQTGGGGGGQTTSPGGGGAESTGTPENSSTGGGGGNGRGGGVSTAVIAGSVVGGVVVLVLGIALVLWLHRRSLRKHHGPGPGPAPVVAAPTSEIKFEPSPPPPQPLPSPGVVSQQQYQYHTPSPLQSQYVSPAVATPPPQYAYSRPPPEADSAGRFEMPVHPQELPSSMGHRTR